MKDCSSVTNKLVKNFTSWSSQDKKEVNKNIMDNTRDNTIYENAELFDYNLRRFWRVLTKNSPQLKATRTKELQDSKNKGNLTVVKSYKLENATPKDEIFFTLVRAIETAFYYDGHKLVPNSTTARWYWRSKKNKTPKLIINSEYAIDKVLDVLYYSSQPDYFIVTSEENKGYSVTLRFRSNLKSVFFDFMIMKIDSNK